MANQEQNPPPQEQPLLLLNKKPLTRSPNMYKEYLVEFWYSAKTLKNSKVFFSTSNGASTADADPGNSTPSNFVPQQQDVNEGTKNTSYDHLFECTDPHVLVDQTKCVSEGLETILTQPKIPPLEVEKKTLEFLRVLAEYQNSTRRETSLFVLRMISSRLKPTCLAATKVVLVVEDFVLGLPFDEGKGIAGLAGLDLKEDSP
uniref:Uncharacterized protein n=1 Tax=Tanacetum cinerariifolium TaxID=118510 RepID=A0A6L2MKU5_TANCI|nr:hypothetical protein [Tanacetum cinerariifolium]